MISSSSFDSMFDLALELGASVHVGQAWLSAAAD